MVVISLFHRSIQYSNEIEHKTMAANFAELVLDDLRQWSRTPSQYAGSWAGWSSVTHAAYPDLLASATVVDHELYGTCSGLAFFWWILPGFEETLSGVPLPLLTRMLFSISALLRWPGSWALVGLGLAGAWALLRRRHLPEGLKHRMWGTALRLALIGPLLRNASVARFSASMEALLGTGASLTRSLHLSAEASGNPLLVAEMRRVEKAISQGEELADQLVHKAYLFPSVMVSLVRVGEEAAVLPDMFGHLARLLDEDLQFRVRTLLALLEPVLMAMISLVVALLIVGIAMPLYAFLQSAL